MSNQFYDGGNYQGGRGGKGGSADRSDAGKIFVGGLSRDTGDEELRNYFTNYGVVIDCQVKRDPNTGNSRGFGFVTFKDSASVDRVVAERNHTLQGKTIDPKRAQARGGMEACRKVFVGGLDPNLTEDKIREYFGRYGKIDLIEQPYDREKNIKKGFCFITYETGDAVDTLCMNQKHHVGGRDVDVKKATPKDKMTGQTTGSSRGRGGYAGRGGDRGESYGGYGAPADYASAAAPGYPAGYDYSAYYAQAGATPYGAYGQTPGAYPVVDPYAQQYAAAAAAAAAPPAGSYDYSAWYGTAAQPPAQQNGGGAMYGRGQPQAASRYQPY